MAAMAKGARNPEQIQAIQKSLIAGVQSGAIKSYVGIPLIQELTNKLLEVKAKMAQAVTGAGMQQPQQGGAPIAQQVMAQAAQADQSQGVEALQSNLPQSYAGGGIIAFEDGGKVERYQNTGFTGMSESDRKRAKEILDAMEKSGEKLQQSYDVFKPKETTPAGRYFSGLGQNFTEANEMAKLRNKLQMQYGPASAVPGLFMRQTDEERLAAKAVASALPNLSFPQLQQLAAEGPSALASFAAPTQAVAPTPTPAAPGAPGAQTQPPPPAPPAASADIGFKMPAMQTYTPTIATLPVRTAPVLTDLDAITKKLPAETKTAVEAKVTEVQNKLEDMDRPGFEAREERLGKRETGLERESAIGRALTGIKTGLRIAGSKERTLAGALGNEGSQGIEDLIRGEAANRAAKDKLEDYRDNLEQQKVASKKGNYQAAQAAGERAADNLYKYTSLNLNAASAGNSQALQRQQIEQTGDIGKAGVLNQGEQLKLSAIDQQNRNALGIAQLQQQGSISKATLAAQEKRYASLDDANKARIMQATAKGLNDFMQNEGATLRAQLAKDYGPNFLTAKDLRSQQAADIFNKRKQAYLADIRGQAIDALSARPSGEY
jgi:hypothetical protein